MPKGMTLKSDGFASNLSAPDAGSTLKAYCEKHGLPYADQGLPVALETFLAYSETFRARYVPELEDTEIASLERDGDGFALTLKSGERAKARNVVLAVGITNFSYTPPVLSSLPAGSISHSFDHRDVEGFRGREVAVIGSGSSAIDLAWALDRAGASARVIARATQITYNSVPDPDAETFINRLQRPASGIGRGWRSYFCASAPLLFHRLPEALRARATQSHMHPAAGWFMREKVEGHIPMSLGRNLKKAEARDGRVNLTIADRTGNEETLRFDHVIAATGYKPDMKRLPFLSSSLCTVIDQTMGAPIVSDNFETSERGVFVMGPAAIHSFGPLMRFMVGAEFAAPRVAAHLSRRFAATGTRRAA
jgi:thioredoxin reductase